MFYKEAEVDKLGIFVLQKLYFIYIWGSGNIFRKEKNI